MKRASTLTLVLTSLIFGFAQGVPAQRVTSSGQRNAQTAVWGSRVARPIAETDQSSTDQPDQSSLRQVADKSSTCKNPPAKLSKDLPTTGKVNIIVMYFAPPQKDDDDDVANQGGTLKNKFKHVKASAITVKAEKIPKIASRCNVKYIALDRKVKRHDFTGNVATGTLGANYAWQSGFTGTGVGVAIVDSGIYNHLDLQTSDGSASRIVYSEDFTGSGSTNDQFGHGTHVAGIVAGNGASSTGAGFTQTFSGIAPNVNLINLRVLDANGAGTDSVVIAAIEQAIALKSTYNIRVLNLSLGRAVQESYQFDPLCQAAEAAWQAGIVVVTAAGNAGRDDSLNSHGYGMIISPGNDPYVITVGAMKAMGTAAPYDDEIASFSSKGPTLFDHIIKPDMVAPGNQITSLLSPGATLPATYPTLVVPADQYMSQAGGQTSAYLSLSGTSMAAPFVSGAAALLIQKDPTLTPDQVKARLMKTADKMAAGFDTYTDPLTGITYGHQYDIFTVGSGYLDLTAAINNTDLTSSTAAALSPYAVFDSTTGGLKVAYDSAYYGGQTLIWGDTLIWGTSLVWGSSVLNAADDGSSDFSLIWGSSTIFGADDDTGGFSLIWGSTVIWGDTVIWGEANYAKSPEKN